MDSPFQSVKNRKKNNLPASSAAKKNNGNVSESKKKGTDSDIISADTLPPYYKVIMLNDDLTSMDFVTEVLKKIFGMSEQKAVKIMLQIHTKGMAICGVYTHEIAETKAVLTIELAKKNNYPLQCLIEKTS